MGARGRNYLHRIASDLSGRLFPRSYADRRGAELRIFSDARPVDEIPPIAHYWSNKHLVPQLIPFGFPSAQECIQGYLARLCRASSSRHDFLSIGSGKAETEMVMAERLRRDGLRNFSFTCLDVNAALLDEATAAAKQRGVTDTFCFQCFDANQWSPSGKYDAVLALQSLHHIVKLEKVLDGVREVLREDGYFLTDDMIGRNGHRRWPEARKLVRELWKELPDEYKYNRQLDRFEKRFMDWDCAQDGFEGVRAQDILPLLIQRFHFEFFFAFGNIIDVFIDRGFGHNFDPNREWDRAFIDKVHAIDVQNLEEGVIKPTHMIAVMRKTPVESTVMYKHFTPEFCVRKSRWWD